jgi:hypothetical protein
MILFRWIKDPLGWSIDGKPEVQEDLKEAIAMNYEWDPAVDARKRAVETVTETAAGPGYLARYLNHNTPSSIPAGQTIEVKLTLQNAGAFDWLSGGDKPFRLGFQWYDAAGQFITFPPNLDFRTALPQTIRSDGTVELRARLRTPAAPGAYQLRWDMVHEMVTWFSSQGDPGLVLPISITPAPVVETPPEAPTTTAPPVVATLDAEDVTASLAGHSDRSYPMRTHADIRRVIIHHTATPANVSVERIAQFQVTNRDLPGIAYHFCVTAEGRVYQTQYLETVSAHAGANSEDSVGVCLIGNFTNSPPPKAQLDATAALLAQLAVMLGLTADQIFGYSELVVTGSPGATWSNWKKTLLTRVRRLMRSRKPITTPAPQPGVPTAGKTIEHYMLFWHRAADNWAEWDLLGTLDYIARFKPAIGFDLEQAKTAKYVTIVGGPGGVPVSAEKILRTAGCKVERIDGKTEQGTRRMFEQLAAQGQRFKTLT